MFKNYLKTAFRNLWKNKVYSFLNIFGLGVGIACAALIFLWVEDELQFNYNNKKISTLYRVMEHQAYDGKTYTMSATPGLLADAIKQEIPGIKNAARATWEQYTLFTLGDKALYNRGYFIDSSIFSMFTIEFVQGSKQGVFNQLHSLVITETMAEKFFPGQKNIVGKSLKVDNKNDFIITGVIKDIPENATYRFDWLAPFKIYFDKNEWLQYWGNNGIITFAELDENADVSKVDKQLYGYIQTKDSTAIPKLFLHSMNNWRLRNNYVDGKYAGGNITRVRMFSVIAWIILVIACINFMNLATARSEKRAREVGVRKVMGAGKRLLVAQFIGEAMIMSFLSVLIAILIITLAMPAFNTLIGKNLSIGYTEPSHIIFMVLIGLVCGFISGSYPALYLSSFNPIYVFKGIRMKGSAPAITRKALVVVQFTASIALIISTIIVFQQIEHIKSRDLGYSKEHLVQTGLRGTMKKNFPVIKQQLLASGYVDNVAMSGLNMLYMGSSTQDFGWEGKDPTKDVLVTQDYVTPEYIPTAGITIKEGRNFRETGTADSMSVVINETLAKMIGKDVVGKNLYRDTGSNSGINYNIIGVAKDFVFDDMYGKSDPLVFLLPDADGGGLGYLYLRVKKTADVEKAMEKVSSIIKANNPGFPFDYTFVDDEFDRIFKGESLEGKLSRVFAVLAIIISCLGLFGLAAYTAERRTKEIGIRKVLGASAAGITAMLSKDFLKLVLISALIAFPVAWYFMHSWLQKYAYRIEISWWVFILAGVLALLIAFMTISFQSLKAALMNPVKSLRTE